MTSVYVLSSSLSVLLFSFPLLFDFFCCKYKHYYVDSHKAFVLIHCKTKEMLGMENINK